MVKIKNLNIKKQGIYVASQVGIFDEIQRMIIGYLSQQPIVLEGDPGVGKNQAINLVAQSLGRKVYRVRCTEEMMARDIIGGNQLGVEKSGEGVATKTEFCEGPIFTAAREGEIVVLDEVNQLLPTVQKSLNSILEDTKMSIGNLEGGYEIQAKDTFGVFMTYNPQTGITRTDLEPAVRDRSKIIYLENPHNGLKSRISLLHTERFSLEEILEDPSLSVRGIKRTIQGLEFVEHKDGKWYEFKKDRIVNGEDIYPYLYFDKAEVAEVVFSDDFKQEIYNMSNGIVNVLDVIDKARMEGSSSLKELPEIEVQNITRFNLNYTSPRLVNRLLKDYISLRERGYSSIDSSSDVVKSLIDCVVPSTEKDVVIGTKNEVDIYLPKTIEIICSKYGVMTNSTYADFQESIKRAAINEGYSKEAVRTSLSLNRPDLNKKR